SERPMGLQPVRLAADLRVRSLVRARRQRSSGPARTLPRDAGARRRLPGFRVPDHADMVFPALRALRAALARRFHVPDRQGRSRPAAVRALSGAGGIDGPLRSARLAAAQIGTVPAPGAVRAALAGNLLPRGVSGLRRAFLPGRSLRSDRRPGPGQRVGHRGNDCDSLAALVVQECRRSVFGIRTQAAGRRSCGRSRLRMLLSALAGLCACVGMALAEPDCMDSAALIHAEAGLPRAAAAITARQELKIAVAGSASSILAGQGGTRAAYPMTLQSALREKLPGVAISVVNAAKPRQTAAEMEAGFGQLIAEQKPTLVVWQTGPVDAMHGVDLDQFRNALDKGVEELQAGGADIILMNMQYSPRTESMIAADNYAEIMRGVALRAEIPLFD